MFILLHVHLVAFRWLLVAWLIVSLLLVCLVCVEPGDEFANEEPVEFAFEDQAFDNSENLAGKMTTPRNHFYLCFASCSLYCHAALPINGLLGQSWVRGLTWKFGRLASKW